MEVFHHTISVRKKTVNFTTQKVSWGIVSVVSTQGKKRWSIFPAQNVTKENERLLLIWLSFGFKENQGFVEFVF